MKKTILLILTLISVGHLKSQVLNVSEIIQEQDQWCWAAVSACILDYYCVPTPQCEIAEYTRNVATWNDFGDTDCCDDPLLGCNYPNYLWGYNGSILDILSNFGNISGYGFHSSLTKTEITTEIQNNKLFIVQWVWNDGSGHFIVGHGLIGDNMYYMDPWFGEGLKIADYDWVESWDDGSWAYTGKITSNPSSSTPANAETIEGSNSVCQGQNSVNYTVPPIENATSYIWTLPTGATGASTTNSIDVNFGLDAVSGNIEVKGVNNCGEGNSSTLHIDVNKLPENAETISGNTNVCQGQNSVIYTVPSIENATSYVWTLPTGATGTSTTNSIDVNFGLDAVSGNIEVKGVNNCGDGNSSSLEVNVKIKPATPNITLNEFVLHSDAPNGNQWYNQNGLISGATEQNYTASIDGDYYVIVTLSGCSSDPSNIINVSGTIINSVELDNTINVYPNPVSNELTIETEKNDKVNFEILNALGHVVFKGDLINKTTIKTTLFAPGIYIIKFETGDTFKFKKIIKQ